MSYVQPTAEKIMGSREIISVKENDSLEVTLKKMKERDKSKIIVVDLLGQPKNIVTLSDIVGNTDLKKPVNSLANLSQVETVDRNAVLDEISNKIQNHHLLVVTDNAKPIGVLTVSDMQRELGF